MIISLFLQESYQGVLLKSAPSELCLAVNTQNFAILQLQNCTQPVSPSELWQFNFTVRTIIHIKCILLC